MEKQLDEGRGDVGLVYHIRLLKYAKILGSIVFRHVRPLIYALVGGPLTTGTSR